jgi:hypothetical protein
MMAKRLLLSNVFVIFLIGNAFSETLSYKFSATITDGWGSSHEGFFAIGTPVTGWYCFNSNSPDYNPYPKNIQTNSVGNPYGFEIVINGIKFHTNTASMSFTNDNPDYDSYRVNDSQYDLTPSGYFQGLENVSHISGLLSLDDMSATYFSGTEPFVPLTTPNLSQFDYTRVMLWGTKADGTGGAHEFFIIANITELYAVPEPASATIMILGASLIASRRKR